MNLDWNGIEIALKSDASIEALRGNRQLIAFMKEAIKSKVAISSTAARAWRKFYRDRRIAKAANATPPTAPTLCGISSETMRLSFLAYAWIRGKALAIPEPKPKSLCSSTMIRYTINEYAKAYEAAKVKTNVA